MWYFALDAAVQAGVNQTYCANMYVVLKRAGSSDGCGVDASKSKQTEEAPSLSTPVMVTAPFGNDSAMLGTGTPHSIA